MKNIGTISWGVILPYLREGDDLVSVVLNGVYQSFTELNLSIEDGDIIAITESIVARTQGNYVQLSDISQAVNDLFGCQEIAVTFPITSRNRISQQLLGITQGVKKVYLQLAFPQDEVGNPLISQELLYTRNVDVNAIYSVQEFRALVGETVMPLTGVDYLEVYEKLNDNIEIVLANDPKAILHYTKNILIAGVHRRHLDRKILLANGAKKVYDLSELLNQPSESHGYNQNFGLYGSNKTGKRIKLFPRDGQDLLLALQRQIFEDFGKKVEVMIYGDGAFKDPQCGIWELHDPCVSPFYTSGLLGTPNEMKLKDLIDAGYNETEIRQQIANNPYSQGAVGTTPRLYTDLLGSLSDLTSGSGDKGTPVVIIKNYFNEEKRQEIKNAESYVIEVK